MNLLPEPSDLDQCESNKASNRACRMSEPENIDPSKLRPGPIRNESLPPELLDQSRAVFDVIGPYIGLTLE